MPIYHLDNRVGTCAVSDAALVSSFTYAASRFVCYSSNCIERLTRMGSQPDALANLATIALNHGHQIETMKREGSPATSTLSASTAAADETSPPIISPTATDGSIGHSTAAPASYYRYPPPHLQHMRTPGHHLYHQPPPHYPRGPYAYPPPTHIYHGYSYHPPHPSHPTHPPHPSMLMHDNEASSKTNRLSSDDHTRRKFVETPKDNDAEDAGMDVSSKSSEVDCSQTSKEPIDKQGVKPWHTPDRTSLGNDAAHSSHRPREFSPHPPPPPPHHHHHYPYPAFGPRPVPPQRLHSYPGPPGYAYSLGYPRHSTHPHYPSRKVAHGPPLYYQRSHSSAPFDHRAHGASSPERCTEALTSSPDSSVQDHEDIHPEDPGLDYSAEDSTLTRSADRDPSLCLSCTTDDEMVADLSVSPVRSDIAASYHTSPIDDEDDQSEETQFLLALPDYKRRASTGKWSSEEDASLRRAVNANSGKNWKKIAFLLPGRTDVQCLHRWQKVLKPGLVKGPWTPEEDTLVAELVSKYGQKKVRFFYCQTNPSFSMTIRFATSILPFQ